MVHSTPLQTAQQDTCLDDIRSEKRQAPVTGRAKKRMLYNRRFVNVVAGVGGKRFGPNSNAAKA